MPSRSSNKPATGKLPTQQMIARKAGVSREAVSQILGGKLADRYNEETQERVREIARQLNYHPNRTAQIMRKGRSNLIGIVHYNSTGETARKTAAYLPQAVSAKGYDYLVIDLQWTGGDMERVFKELVQARVEGVIVLAYAEIGFTEAHLDILRQASIPVISLYGDDGLNVPLVCGNGQRSFAKMTRHLWNLGHRKIIQPAENGMHRNTRERIAGFCSEAAACEAPHYLLDLPDFFQRWPDLSRKKSVAITVRLDFKRYGHDFVEANYQFGKQLFKEYPLPDAVLGYNDRSAFGIFTAAWELGLKVPDDIALTGDDDDGFGKYPIYSLTTMRPDIEKSSNLAVDLLLKSLKGEPTEGIRHAIEALMILRGSCGYTGRATQH